MIKRPFFMLTQPKLNYDLVETDPKEPKSIAVPPNLILLLNEPIDSSRTSLIKKGDTVEKGQKFSLYEDSSVYAVSPVAGTINGIDTYSDDFGNISTYVVIKNDQGQTADTASQALDLSEDIESADQYLRMLPGAPPLKLFSDPDKKIGTVVITCADPDILSTTRQFVTLTHQAELEAGAALLKQITGVSKICAVVPDGLDIPDGLGSIQVVKTDPHYPSNLPAMILKDHFGTILPAGKTPEDIGYCFMSPEAVVSLNKAYENKAAGFQKNLTVIGKQGELHRAKATIGTPIKRVFSHFNIEISDQDRIVIGGPMTGFATFTVNHPVGPDMDMIIVQDKADVAQLSDDPCVNCGKCIQACPADIPVNLLVRFLEADQYEEAADKYDLESCIECGICAFVCTARIPLYQYIRLGKHELLKLRAEDVLAEDVSAEDVSAEDVSMETANE